MSAVTDRSIRNKGFSVTIARSADEVAALRPHWEQLQGGQLTTDLDWFLTTVAYGPRVERPHVMHFERGGEPQGMVLARLQRMELSCRFGYRKLYEPPLRVVNVVPGGFLGPLVEDDPQVMLSALSSSVPRREVDALNFPAVRLGSPLETAVGGVSRRVRRSVTADRAHWQKAIPESFELFLASLSSSTRQGVKRYANKLEREFADDLELRHVSTLTGIDGFFVDAAAVAAKTYQGGLGVGVREDDELQRRLARLGVERGWFRACVLRLGGRPAAFWHGYAYRGTFRTMVPGYDPAYEKLNIGTYVLMKLIAGLCDDPAIVSLDYGFGDAEYKRRFGDEQWQEHDLSVFSPTFRAMRIHTVRSALNSGVGVGRSLVRDSGNVNRVKRVWRQRIADQA